MGYKKEQEVQKLSEEIASLEAQKRDAVARSQMLGLSLTISIVLFLVLLLRTTACAEDYRGFQIGTYPVPTSQIKLSVKDAYTMFGSNIVRYQIVDPTITKDTSIEDYTQWWKGKIEELIEVIRYIKSNHIPVHLVVDMHTTPGGVLRKTWGSQHWVLTNEGQEHWKKLWEYAINTLNNAGVSDRVRAWEPINEPVDRSTKDLWDKYDTLFRHLRPLTDKPLIASMSRRDVNWYNTAEPFHSYLGEIWYTAHHYKPNEISFYNILGSYDDNRYKKAVRKFRRKPYKAVKRHLRPLRKFTKKHGVVGYIGEFGVSVYAQDHVRADLFKYTLRQFNRWGFNWTIHALNEAPVWQPNGKSVAVIKNAVGVFNDN